MDAAGLCETSDMHLRSRKAFEADIGAFELPFWAATCFDSSPNLRVSGKICFTKPTEPTQMQAKMSRMSPEHGVRYLAVGALVAPQA